MADEETKEEPKSEGIPLWKWIVGGAGAYVLGSFVVDKIRDAQRRRRWRDLAEAGGEGDFE